MGRHFGIILGTILSISLFTFIPSICLQTFHFFSFFYHRERLSGKTDKAMLFKTGRHHLPQGRFEEMFKKFNDEQGWKGGVGSSEWSSE